MSADSLYSFNPHIMTQNAGFNNDFMANATAQINNPYAQQAFMQGLALKQPTGDTFQKSEGGSGLGAGLKMAAVGGVGVGAGTYFFGDKFGAAITQDGKTFSDDILKAFQTDPLELAKTESIAEFAKRKELLAKAEGFASAKEYEAIKQYVQTPAADRAALPREVTDLVPDAVKSAPDDAILKSRLGRTALSIEGIDIEGITKQALKEAQEGNLAYQIENVKNLANRKSLLEGLAQDATPAQIEELITKNPSAFGITKTAEAEIQAEAQAIAQRYGTKAGALNEVTPLVTNAENSVKNLRTTLNSQVAAHWDDTAKAFRESAPSTLKNAAKSFKWAKAGKFAAIAAGAGLVLGWMFGGNKS